MSWALGWSTVAMVARVYAGSSLVVRYLATLFDVTNPRARRDARYFGQGEPAAYQVIHAARKASRDTGIGVRPNPGVQPQVTSGSSRWTRRAATSLPPLRAGSLICSHSAPG